MGLTLLRTGARGLCLVTFLLGGCGAMFLLVREPCADLLHTYAAGGADGVAALSFTQALTGLCAGAALVCSTWLAGTASLVVLIAIVQAAARAHFAEGRGRPESQLWLMSALQASQVLACGLCPNLARRLVLASCGIALGSGLGTGLAVAPATADSWGAVDPLAATPTGTTSTGTTPTGTTPTGTTPSATTSAGRVLGLAVPDRTVGAGDGPVTPPVTTTVTPGDSLWSISARFLPSDASNTVIDAAWHEMHRTNLDVIGLNPDVIFPGTTLHVPWLDAHERKEVQ